MEPQTIVEGNLLRNCVLFGRLLRALGVEVTPTQMVDLVDSLQFVDIGNKYDFQNSARALLVNRQTDLEVFDRAFELFWQARETGDLLELDLGTLLHQSEQPKVEDHQLDSSNDAGENEQEEDDDDESDLETVFTYSAREVLRQKDFGKLREDELLLLKRLMGKMKWNLPQRRTRRTISHPSGNFLDMRQSFRRNLRHGGEFLQLSQRKRKYKRRPVVVICDISGSMERYSRVLLQFIFAISSDLDKVESFVFSTRLTRITKQLLHRDVDDALDEAARSIHDWAGGTRIGDAIKTFNFEWGRRVLGQGAVVLIISDGWDRGDVAVLAHEMDRLHRSCHRLLWLNPLLGAADYEPLVRGIQAALPHIDDFLPVHNLASLEQLADLLAGWR